MALDPSKFLSATTLTNYEDSVVQRVIQQCKAEVDALKIIDQDEKTKQLLMRLFYFTRDAVRWKMGIYPFSASETIVRGYGSCCNKANLLAALFRGCGFPAGFHVMSVHHRYLGDQIPPRWNLVRQNMDAKTRHFYVAVYLKGRWIRGDPTDDIGVWRCMGHLVEEAKLVTWDGESEAMLSLKPKWIYADDGPLVDIDSHICRAGKNTAMTEALSHMLDPVDKFTREQGAKYNTIEAFQQGIVDFMWKNHFFKMLLFDSVISYRVRCRQFGTAPVSILMLIAAVVIAWALRKLFGVFMF